MNIMLNFLKKLHEEPLIVHKICSFVCTLHIEHGSELIGSNHEDALIMEWRAF